MIGWLVGWLVDFIWFCSLGLYGLVPFAHAWFPSYGRCDPCEFLLAIRGFIELVSVMVRLRSSIIAKVVIVLHIRNVFRSVCFPDTCRKPCARFGLGGNRAEASLRVHASWLDVQSAPCTVRPAFMALENTRRL